MSFAVGKKVATVLNTATLSNALLIDGVLVVGLVAPSAWDGGNVSFEGSIDGTNYYTVLDQGGSAVLVTVTADRIHTFDGATISKFMGLTHVKCVAAASAVGADRTIDLIIRRDPK